MDTHERATELRLPDPATCADAGAALESYRQVLAILRYWIRQPEDERSQQAIRFWRVRLLAWHNRIAALGRAYSVRRLGTVDTHTQTDRWMLEGPEPREYRVTLSPGRRLAVVLDGATEWVCYTLDGRSWSADPKDAPGAEAALAVAVAAARYWGGRE
jgi:hypothetical protein